MVELDTTTRERLADLRRLLRDGQARTGDRTAVGQHAAIVILDAACEHATALAGGHLGLSKVDKLEATMQKLREQLPEWQAAGWKGVLDQRAQRNQAQHRGVRPDVRDVARWSDDAEAFIASLVRAVFGVDLADVAVSDGVRDADVRRLLRNAEQALDEGDYAEAKYSAVDAFDAARDQWRAQRLRPGVPWYDRREQNLPEGVTVDLERLRDQAEVQPFATDFGEYLWLKDQHRRYTRRAPVPVDDAIRALAFVTEWVLRWESHSRRRVDREAEWMAQQTPARSGHPDAPPSVQNFNVIVESGAEYVDPATVHVVVTLQDLPSDERFRWCFEVGQAMTELLTRHGHRGGAHCDERGLLEFDLLQEPTRTDELPATVNEALERGTTRWRAFCEQQNLDREKAARSLDACKEAVSPWLGTRVQSVDFVADRDDAIRVHFASRLDARLEHFALQLLRARFAENPGHHRIEVRDDWATVPLPTHDDTVGAILAHLLSEFDRIDATGAALRAELQDLARRLEAQITAQSASLRSQG